MAERTTKTGMLALLDESARSFDFPCWDSARFTCGAMRATGFRWRKGVALVVQSVDYVRSESFIARRTFAFGEGLPEVGYLGWEELVAEDVFFEDLDEHTLRCKPTGVIFEPETSRFARPDDPPSSTFALKLGGQSYTVDLTLPLGPGARPQRARRLQRITPPEVVLFQLCEVAGRDVLFPSDAEVATRAGIAAKATALFRFDDWQHPAAGQEASASPDLVAMAEALDKRKPLRALPGESNCDFRHWLEIQLELHTADEAIQWGVTRRKGKPSILARGTREARKARETREARSRRARKPATRKGSAEAWLTRSMVTPQWTDAQQVAGAMRATGFVTSSGPALLLEAVKCAGDSGLDRELFAYGPGVGVATTAGIIGYTGTLVDWQELYEPIGDRLVRCRYAAGERAAVTVAGKRRRLELKVPALEGLSLKHRAKLSWLRPTDVVLYQICDTIPWNELFLPNKELTQRAGLPARAKRLFRFDDWQHPRPGQPLAASPDVQAMVAALDAGEPLRSLPGTRNGQWRLWLDSILSKRRRCEADEWTKPWRHQDAPKQAPRR
ncbi:MAG: hypothetical protein ABI333_03330 [bacterium]